MPFQEGEVYRCPDERCGCEVTVTRGAAPGQGGDRTPTCCCGQEMTKVS
ncbi:hypothetical protein [Streptomyces sp. NPDC004976]